MRRSRVSKTCEFPRRDGVFPQKWPSRAGAEGGAGGSAAEAGCEPQGVKNAKNWGKMSSFGASTCKFPYKTAIFGYKAIWPNPPNSFFPTWFCDFPARGRQKGPCEKTKLEEGTCEQKPYYAENLRFARVFWTDLRIQGVQNTKN